MNTCKTDNSFKVIILIKNPKNGTRSELSGYGCIMMVVLSQIK